MKDDPMMEWLLIVWSLFQVFLGGLVRGWMLWLIWNSIFIDLFAAKQITYWQSVWVSILLATLLAPIPKTKVTK